MNNGSLGKLKRPAAIMMNTSSKRSQRTNAVIQVASCLVDGCKADLRLCREYHQRHKVCELHWKTPKVMIQGQEQRFCQQCSRFHSLEEFDEGKRSCRRHLAGHNKRRRKPLLEPMPKSLGAFLSDYKGMVYHHSVLRPQLYPTHGLMNSAWDEAPNSSQSQLSEPRRNSYIFGIFAMLHLQRRHWLHALSWSFFCLSTTS